MEFFFSSDTNGLIRFKKILQDLKKIIRSWIKDKKLQQSGAINSIKEDLIDIDKNLDSGNVSDEILLKRMELTRRQLHDINQMEARDYLNISFPNRLSTYQVADMDRSVFRDEIRVAVSNCGENKSSGPDGYTFEFFRRYWRFIGSDFCLAVECFFKSGSFPKGSNSSFIALIPKVTDAKFVTDFKPISLIGYVYKVVTKILANHLATVISDLVFDIQSAFVANRQILDGPFILNELLAWGKRKKKQAMIFKVDFAKACDSAASLIGCAVMQNPFRYLGLMVGDSMSQNLLGLTRFKSYVPGYPSGRLKLSLLEDKVLASKKNGGLGVSSFHTLNHALLLKWVLRFLSQDGSLWYRVIQALYSDSFELHPVNQSLIWCSILREMQVKALRVRFAHLFVLETDKESTVASKLGSSSVDASFGRSVRNGVERQQWDDLNCVSDSVTLSASKYRWICDLNGDGVFRVKEVHTILDDIFLPSAADATR
nr:RNA-directed DNA polymerase, eukaryota [Tanacetum cinerariifolium]